MNEMQHRNLDRREFLARAGLGVAAAGLAGFSPLAAAAPKEKKIYPKGKAEHCIMLWLAGGMSHVDTFDPKPDAGYDYCGPLNKPIATNVDGIRVVPAREYAT